MSDPYRFAEAPQTPTDQTQQSQPQPARHYGVRVLLGVLAAIGVIGNAVTSLGGAHPVISLGFGVLAVVTIVLLVVHYRKHRAQRSR